MLSTTEPSLRHLLGHLGLELSLLPLPGCPLRALVLSLGRDASKGGFHALLAVLAICSPSTVPGLSTKSHCYQLHLSLLLGCPVEFAPGRGLCPDLSDFSPGSPPASPWPPLSSLLWLFIPRSSVLSPGVSPFSFHPSHPSVLSLQMS